MDTKTLIEGLKALQTSDFTWKFILYNTTKGSDGQEIKVSDCNMQNISGWVAALRSAILEKGIAERTVTEYSPFLTKELIGAMKTDDELIFEQLTDMLFSMDNSLTYHPDDYVTGVMPPPRGYGFYGFSKDENDKIINRILFLRRSNPFMDAGKSMLCSANNDEVVENTTTLLRFITATDFLMLNNMCYFFSTAIEKDFNFEDRNIAYCSRMMKVIAEANIISDYDKLESVAMKGKNTKKFYDFDSEILEYIVKLPIIERMGWLSNYGIITDNEGKMDSRDSEQCELIIDLLCCRSCVDVFGRLSVVNKITPRE